MYLGLVVIVVTGRVNVDCTILGINAKIYFEEVWLRRE